MGDPPHTTLSDARRSLLQDARDALDAATRLHRRAAVAAQGAGGQVTTGYLWSTLAGYLPPLVSVAAKQHPEIKLSIRQLRYLIPALRRGEVDLMITLRVRW